MRSPFVGREISPDQAYRSSRRSLSRVNDCGVSIPPPLPNTSSQAARVNRFWERVMLALVVCVPVPALAFSGLSIPLPSVVERIAAALVPFAGAETIEDGTTLASGRIVQAPGEKTFVRSSRTRTTTVHIIRRANTTKPAAGLEPNVVRIRTTPVAVSAPPSTTSGEGTAAPAPAPAGPAADTSTPAPHGQPAPAPNGDETTKPPTLPALPAPPGPVPEPNPAELLPGVDVDLDLEDVELLEPVEELVDELLPGLNLPLLGPSERERRNGGLLGGLLGGGK
jgi:hypothetical protein